MGDNAHKTWTGERLETFIQNETTIEHLHRYALAMEFVKNKIVVDIACGEGYGTKLLGLSAAKVTGIDIDRQTVSNATQRYATGNIDFITGNAENIPIADQHCDVIVSFETLEHVHDHDKVLREFKRILKPAGMLIISTPDKEQYTDRNNYRNPYHLHELYEQEFKELLERYFGNVTLLGQQMTVSSIIRNGTAQYFDQYAGNFNRIEKNAASTDALYLIAFASDQPLPAVNNSIFDGRSIFENALEAKEKMVTGTITYRLGHAMLYPFKFIKRIFNRH